MTHRRIGMLTVLLVTWGCQGDKPAEKKAELKPYVPEARKEIEPINKGEKVDVVPPRPVDVEKRPATSAPGQVSLAAVDYEGFQRQIAGQKGKLVVVDGWATWCPPCKAKFPKFVELAKKNVGPKVAFMSLSFDTQEAEMGARDFLASQQAENLINLRITDDINSVQERLNFEALPQYLLFDTTGKKIFSSSKLEKLEEELASRLGP